PEHTRWGRRRSGPHPGSRGRVTGPAGVLSTCQFGGSLVVEWSPVLEYPVADRAELLHAPVPTENRRRTPPHPADLGPTPHPPPPGPPLSAAWCRPGGCGDGVSPWARVGRVGTMPHGASGTAGRSSRRATKVAARLVEGSFSDAGRRLNGAGVGGNRGDANGV